MKNVAHVLRLNLVQFCKPLALRPLTGKKGILDISPAVQFDCPSVAAAAAGYRGYIGLAGNLCANHWFRLLLRFFLTLFLVSSGKVLVLQYRPCRTDHCVRQNRADHIRCFVSSFFRQCCEGKRAKGLHISNMSLSADSFFCCFC